MNEVDPKSFNLPDAQYLKPDHVDSVARALLSLTRELCVLNDRVLVLEEVLAEKGIEVSKAVDNYRPGEDFQKKTDVVTGRIIRNVIASLRGSESLEQAKTG